MLGCSKIEEQPPQHDGGGSFCGSVRLKSGQQLGQVHIRNGKRRDAASSMTVWEKFAPRMRPPAPSRGGDIQEGN